MKKTTALIIVVIFVGLLVPVAALVENHYSPYSYSWYLQLCFWEWVTFAGGAWIAAFLLK